VGQRRRMRALVHVCVAAAGAALVIGLGGPPAVAAPCPGAGAQWNTVTSPDTNGRGVRVTIPGLLIENDPVDCLRVAAVGDNNSSGLTYVEVGWYEDPSGGLNFPCIPNTSGPPKVIAFAAEDGVVAGCWATPSSPSGRDTFTVHDDNQNGLWTFLHNGNLVWTSPDLDPFHTGIIVTNAERWDLDDGAHADWDGLQRMGSTASWSNWQGTYRNTDYDNDPDFRPCIHTNTHVESKKNSNPC